VGTDKNNDINMILRNAENFLEYIKKLASSPDAKTLRKTAEAEPHPSRESLYDLALNWTDEKQKSSIIDHIAHCRMCSKELIDIMEMNNELDDYLEQTVDSLPLFKKIRNMISDFSIPVYSFLEGSLVTRSETERKIPNYTIGEKIVVSIDIKEDGYLVVIHLDENENLSLVFPASSQDNGFVKGGSVRKISGKVTGPKGDQYFKVFWTAKRLLNSEMLDSQDPLLAEYIIDQYVEAIMELGENEWSETLYKFAVI